MATPQRPPDAAPSTGRAPSDHAVTGIEAEYVRRNRAAWDADADDYQSRNASTLAGMAWGVWQLPEAGLGVLGEVADRDVLELGCGGAQWSVALARAGARVIGLDLSERQLAHARLGPATLGNRICRLLAEPKAWTRPRLYQRLGRPAMSLRTLGRRVREVAGWRRSWLVAKGDPDREVVLATLRQTIAGLPDGAVVLAEDETHVNLLPWVWATWIAHGACQPGTIQAPTGGGPSSARSTSPPVRRDSPVAHP
jgi:SAM-dependent methyltransferase